MYNGSYSYPSRRNYYKHKFNRLLARTMCTDRDSGTQFSKKYSYAPDIFSSTVSHHYGEHSEAIVPKIDVVYLHVLPL